MRDYRPKAKKRATVRTRNEAVEHFRQKILAAFEAFGLAELTGLSAVQIVRRME